MLTPQEVSERAFPKASFGGYNMAQVDEFLDVLTEDYSTLYSENAVLKSKMKVLVDKVEEYRSTEEAGTRGHGGGVPLPGRGQAERADGRPADGG